MVAVVYLQGEGRVVEGRGGLPGDRDGVVHRTALGGDKTGHSGHWKQNNKIKNKFEVNCFTNKEFIIIFFFFEQ